MKIIHSNYAHLLLNASVLTPLSPSLLQVARCGDDDSFSPRTEGTGYTVPVYCT